MTTFFNNIHFKKNGEIDVKKIFKKNQRAKELNNNLMFFFTGFVRTAEKIAKNVTKNLMLKKNTVRQMENHLKEAKIILTSNGSLDDFGRLLNETWNEKKKLSDLVSNRHIDEIYQTAIKSGALGGKLCGAGGGGFILFYVPKEKQNLLKKKLSNLIHVPIEFEHNGSQIIFSDNQKSYINEEIERNNKINHNFTDLTE